MKTYDKIEGYIPAFIFVIICLAMLVQIFSRSLFGISFSWNIEFSRYAQVWLTFIGIGYVRKVDAHIKITILLDGINKRLSHNGRIVFFIIRTLISLTFMVLLVVLGIQLSIKSWNFHSSAMQLRQFWLYICVPLGALTFLFREIQSSVKYFHALSGGEK